jgi:hypothetical protein
MQPRKLIFGMQTYLNPTRRNMEDNINIVENGRRPQFFFKFKKLERQLQLFFKQNTTSISCKWKTTPKENDAI